MVASNLINKPWKLLVLIVLEGVVFQLVLWNIHRFIAVNATVFVAISNAILMFSLFTISITVIIYGNVIRSRVYNNLGFAIFLYAIFIFIFLYEGIDVKISAFATLALAFAAFMAIDENRRLRNDNRRIQEETLINERHRLALERIRSWAEETFEKISQQIGHGFEGSITPVIFIVHERLRVIKGGLLSNVVKSIGIETAAKQLEGGISKEVTLAIQILSEYVGRLGTEEDIVKFREFIGDTDFGDKLKPFNSLEEVITAEKEVLQQLKKVLDSVTKELVPSK